MKNYKVKRGLSIAIVGMLVFLVVNVSAEDFDLNSTSYQVSSGEIKGVVDLTHINRTFVTGSAYYPLIHYINSSNLYYTYSGDVCADGTRPMVYKVYDEDMTLQTDTTEWYNATRWKNMNLNVVKGSDDKIHGVWHRLDPNFGYESCEVFYRNLAPPSSFGSAVQISNSTRYVVNLTKEASSSSGAFGKQTIYRIAGQIFKARENITTWVKLATLSTVGTPSNWSFSIWTVNQTTWDPISSLGSVGGNYSVWNNHTTLATSYATDFSVRLTKDDYYMAYFKTVDLDDSNYYRLRAETDYYSDGKLRRYDGSSWANLTTDLTYFSLNANESGMTPDIIKDHNGRLWIIYGDNSPYSGWLWYSYSDDNGTTWIEPIRIIQNQNGWTQTWLAQCGIVEVPYDNNNLWLFWGGQYNYSEGNKLGIHLTKYNRTTDSWDAEPEFITYGILDVDVRADIDEHEIIWLVWGGSPTVDPYQHYKYLCPSSGWSANYTFDLDSDATQDVNFRIRNGKVFLPDHSYLDRWYVNYMNLSYDGNILSITPNTYEPTANISMSPDSNWTVNNTFAIGISRTFTKSDLDIRLNLTKNETTQIISNLNVVPSSGSCMIDITSFDTSKIDNYNEIVMSFKANSTDGNNVNFTLSGLSPNTTYQVKMDGVDYVKVKADSLGTIGFNCSIWSEHTFTIINLDMGCMMYPLLGFVLTVMIMVALVGIIGKFGKGK